MVNKTFIKLLDEMRSTHEKKNDDYASKDPYENFMRAAIIASWFDDPVDKVFATMIGIKLARLVVLKNSKRAPNNESVADSHLDETVYSAIWAAYERDHPIKGDGTAPSESDRYYNHKPPYDADKVPECVGLSGHMWQPIMQKDGDVYKTCIICGVRRN